MRPDDVEELGLELLDHQLIDSEGVLCGNVDDIELREEDGRLYVDALLSGAGAWPQRLPRPVRGLARRVLFKSVTRIPWSAVKEVGASVNLDGRAAEFGLGKGEDRARAWLRRLPGSGS